MSHLQYLYQMMYRHQMGLTEKINEKNLNQTIAQNKNKNKFTSLAPYISEIQRRKKMRSINKRSKKNLNESSSKSFRIKEKSVTLLHKDLAHKTREQPSIHNLPIRKIQDKNNKQRRTRSVQKHHELQISKTIENKNVTPNRTNNNFFNDLYARVKSKIDKEKPLRRNKFETLEERTKSEKPGELNMYKISKEFKYKGYTNIPNMNADKEKAQPELQQGKKIVDQTKKKTNFRKNKYEILQSSVGELQQQSIIEKQQQRVSDGKIYLDKKQSNSAINIQMDKIAERQMEKFYQQVITKEIHRSIEKSTEKYFSFQSYRPTKSKNEIEVYVSTVANPSLNKVSKSTNQKSDHHKSATLPNKNECLDYDFDFKNEEQHVESMINQDNASEEQSQAHLKRSMGEFQKQRKQVQIQFFNKPSPDLQWSEDECKIDQL